MTINNQSPKVYDFFDIVASMKGRQMITLYESGERFEGIVNRVEAESGSGKTWNVTLHTGQTLFIRTA